MTGVGRIGCRQASVNLRFGTRGLIADSSLQVQRLIVVDERDAIGALEAASHGQPNRHSVPRPPQPEFARYTAG